MQEIQLILVDIRSAQNVGSMFRTADAAAVSRIYLCGYTPAPIDRFGRERSDIAKAALGAQKTVPWEAREDIKALIAELKMKGFLIAALEQAENSIDYKALPKDKPLAIIVGNEVDGVPEDVLALSDYIAEIRMHGEKESLNVAVALGIALFAQR